MRSQCQEKVTANIKVYVQLNYHTKRDKRTGIEILR